MPYIPKADRSRVASDGATNPGELNYELTIAIRAYLRGLAPLKYAHINEVVSALEWVRPMMIWTEQTNIPLDASEGEFHVQLYRICKRYRDVKTQPHITEASFSAHVVQAERDIIGALECCKLEFYRRVAVPYEDRKIKTNGDVYA